jgi:uncharacterized protein
VLGEGNAHACRSRRAAWGAVGHPQMTSQMLTQPLEPLSAALAIATMAIGSGIQASVGIGLALFVVPLLALIDHSFIPGPMLLAGVTLAVMTANRDRAAIDVAALRSALLGLCGGTIVGVWALGFVSGSDLNKTVGALVLLAVLLSIAGCKFTANSRSLMVAGAAAGVMGAMVGIHGPPISLVFQHAEPRTARAMLAAFFAVAYLGAVAALAAFGLFGLDQLVRAGILLPGVAIGLCAAPHIARHIDTVRLRRIILGIAAISGVALLAR